MKIPEIRERLEQIGQAHGIQELLYLASELSRRPAKKRAPVRSKPMTPELRQQIRDYAFSNPDKAQQQIAELFGVNIGRVSEATRGFRQ